MSKVYDYIQKELHLNVYVPLKIYREGGRGIILPGDQLIYASVTDNGKIGPAPVTTLVFEIGKNNESGKSNQETIFNYNQFNSVKESSLRIKFGFCIG